MTIVEKRQKEIEEEYRIKQEIIKQEEIKKQNYFLDRINNKKEILKNHIGELYIPFKNIVLQIDDININEPDTYIMNYIIEKTIDIIINLKNDLVKDFYLKLKKIKDYYENDFNDNFTNKNIRGKIMLKTFLNICSEYDLDKYIIEKYEEYLKKTNSYDSQNFYFLEKIVGIYIKIIQLIIPNIYFL